MIRPIHFSVPMVRALLAGEKTQTRRIGTSVAAGRIQVGDELWVREAYRLEARFDRFGSPLKAMNLEGKRLDYEYEAHIAGGEPIVGWGKERTARTMPKIFSRFVLTVTEVRRELLQAITEDDAKAEGMREPYFGDGDPPFEECGTTVTRRMQYRNLWNRLNPETPWSTNPEVVVISFTRRIERIADREAA
jgi:hypothetical protein